MNIKWWVTIVGSAAVIAGAVAGGVAFAQAPGPIQTINTNEGIPCNALGSQGAVMRCRPQVTYGCTSSTTGQQILNSDGQRTGIIFQDTGSVPIVLCFGDACVGNNGFVVLANNSFLWSNLGNGNLPGRLLTNSISIISSGASSCAFLFTN